MSPSVREWLASGLEITSAQYDRALETRAKLVHDLDAAMSTVDALLMPSSFVPLPLADDEAGRLAYSLQAPNAVFNMSGYPAISIPSGRDRNGAPLGLQIAMPKGADYALLHLAEAVEDAIAD